MIKIGLIEEAFKLSGRKHLTIVPGIRHENLPYKLEVGSPIVIVNPDGTEINSSIYGVEMVNTKTASKYAPISLPPSITKEHIARGAVICVRKQNT